MNNIGKDGGDAWNSKIKRLNNLYYDHSKISVNHHPLENIMSVCSREKRKSRRKDEQMELKAKSMDIHNFVPLTETQKKFWYSLEDNIVTVALGASGTGKTLTALHYGFDYMATGHFSKIVYVRSDVGCEHQRGRGALKGDYDDKFRPLLTPLLDNIPLIFRTQGAAEYLFNKKKIEAVFLEDIRGRTFNDTMVIFDEAQNSTIGQTKTVLSRIGKRSKLALIGDTSQTDLNVFTRHNGLLDAYHRLETVKGVGRILFKKEDIVRNSILADILYAYEK